jgi:hypothetical protein
MPSAVRSQPDGPAPPGWIGDAIPGRLAALELLLDAGARLAGGSRSAAPAPGEVDWPWFVELAHRHRLLPACDRALAMRDPAFSLMPVETRDLVHAEARRVAARALASARQLAVALASLRDAGISALPYKGPALALQAYGDPGGRDFVDLDIVIQPAHRARARRVLEGIGYVPLEEMTAAEESILLDAYGHVQLIAKGGGTPVELHWRFSSAQFPWSPRVADVLSRAHVERLGGLAAPMIDPADSLVLQATHGARHAWQRLEWLAAMVATSRLVAGEEPRVARLAGGMHALRAVQTAFELARRLFGTPVAPAFAGDAGARALAADLDEGIRRAAMQRETPSRTGHHRPVLRAMDRAADRVRYLVLSAVLPTMNERDLIALPGLLAPLYYPVRLARVISGRTAWLRPASMSR